MTAATKHVFKLEGRESTVTTVLRASPNREVALRKSGEQGIDSLTAYGRFNF